MKAKSLPWHNLTSKFHGTDIADMSVSDLQYALVGILANMAKFTIDPKSVAKIEDPHLRAILDDIKGPVAQLMRTVAPNCKR